jgi:hypothetical protein
MGGIMSEYSRKLAERKREARRDYLNRLYHTWNVLLARWDHKDKRSFERIQKIEGKIFAEQERRKAAGWPSSFTKPYNPTPYLSTPKEII